MPALLYLQRAIESDPADGQSWHLLGKCLADHGQLTGAYDCFQQVGTGSRGEVGACEVGEGEGKRGLRGGAGDGRCGSGVGLRWQWGWVGVG